MQTSTEQQTQKVHTYIGAPFPNSHPTGYDEDNHFEIQFNPTLHLSLETPKWIKTLIQEGVGPEADIVQFPVHAGSATAKSAVPTPAFGSTVPFTGLAFTAPFRLLSDEGVRVVRKIIKYNEKYAKSNERIPKTLRGLGYRSKFIRDLAYSQEVLQHLSRCSGDSIHPHSMPMVGLTCLYNFGSGVKTSFNCWLWDTTRTARHRIALSQSTADSILNLPSPCFVFFSFFVSLSPQNISQINFGQIGKFGWDVGWDVGCSV